MLTKKFKWVTAEQKELPDIFLEESILFMKGSFDSEYEAIEALELYLEEAGMHWITTEEFELKTYYLKAKDWNENI